MPFGGISTSLGREVELIPGSELIAPLAALAERLNVPEALLGATDETLALAATRLEAAYSGLPMAARIAPSYGFDPTGAGADEALTQVAASGAGRCFLALGAPKQKILAARSLTHSPGIGFVSIGKGLDFIAGSQNARLSGCAN